MNKYCTNCGKKIDYNMDYCLGCGKMINKTEIKTKKDITETLALFGLIISLIGFYISIVLALNFDYAYTNLNKSLTNSIGNTLLLKLIFGIFYTIISTIPSTVGLILSIIPLRKTKNIPALIGLIISLISIICSIFVILLLLK